MNDPTSENPEARRSAAVLHAAFPAAVPEHVLRRGERLVRAAAVDELAVAATRAAPGRRRRGGRGVAAAAIIGAVLGSTAVSAAVTGSPNPAVAVGRWVAGDDDGGGHAAAVAEIDDVLDRADALQLAGGDPDEIRSLLDRAVVLLAAHRADLPEVELRSLEERLRTLLGELAERQAVEDEAPDPEPAPVVGDDVVEPHEVADEAELDDDADHDVDGGDDPEVEDDHEEVEAGHDVETDEEVEPPDDGDVDELDDDEVEEADEVEVDEVDEVEGEERD